MTFSKKLLTSIFGVSAIALTLVGCGEKAPAPTSSEAADPAIAEAIKARQANFKKLGGSMKVFKDQLADGTLSKPELLAAATILVDASKAQADKFPAGSDSSSGEKTGARPEIWTDRANFDKGMSNLVAASEKLVSVSENGDAAAIGAQFKAVGETCATCHKQFRAKD